MKEAFLGAARWIIDYLEIPNYLSIRTRGVTQGEKRYDCEKAFWRDVLGRSFRGSHMKNPVTREGDVVILQNFQLSPWCPRLPGLYWTSTGMTVREITSDKLKHSRVLGFHFAPYDKKRRMTQGGLGTIRLAKHDRLRLYGATTSGKLDAAIPILVSSNVAGNILRFSKRYPLMEVDLRGILRIIPRTYLPDFWGAHVPKLCLYVNSILNVKKYISDFALHANAWTIYHDPRARNTEKRFGYTYCHFNPIDESSIIEATDWIYDYIEEYTKGRGIPLSDYDEQTCRFESAVLPLANVMEGNIDYDALSSLFGGLDFRQQAPFLKQGYM
ncbi:MAG: hypothetical protein ACFFCW_34740 [Candidatus Hodarchaeota archaeon]